MKIDRSFFTSILFISLVIGIAVRLILVPITSYEYDSYFWGTVIQNINSGNGLYELMGYYYMPPWGYILGFLDMIWNSILSMDVIGIRFTDLLGIEALDNTYHRATVVTPFFNVLFKIPLVICDIVVGYLVYRMVMSRTSDRKKAEFAFALWFLCPVLIYMTGIQPMFDTFSALFTVLCILLLMNRVDLLGGVMFASAAMLKVFPALILPILIVYILKSSDERSTRVRRCIMFTVGAALTSVIIMLPNIIRGNVYDTMYFMVGRAGSWNTAVLIVLGLLVTAFAVVTFIIFVRKWENKRFIATYLCAVISIVLAGLFALAAVRCNGVPEAVSLLSEKIPQMFTKIGMILIVTVLEFVLALMFYMRNSGSVDDQMMVYSLCGLTATVYTVLNPAPQYCIVLIPFLVYHIAVRDRGFMILWIFLGIAATYKNLVMNNFGLLTTLSEYFGVFSSDWILSCMHSMDSSVLGIPLYQLLDMIGGIVYFITLLCVLIFSAEGLLTRWPKAVTAIQAVKNFGHRRGADDS